MALADRLICSKLLGLAVQRTAVIFCLGLLTSALSAQEGIYDWDESKTLIRGIRYVRVKPTQPHKIVINCLRIDSQAPGIRFHATDRCRDWTEGKEETRRKSVRNFIRESRMTDRKLVVATNADAFSPWPVPYQKETFTDVLGLLVSDGTLVSRGSGTPSFVVSKDGDLSITTTVADTSEANIETAVSGFALCLIDGQVPASGNDLHPRTGLGLSADRRFVLMMTIDGRQAASAGATTQTVGNWLKHFGAHNGINMDGGGSTTMAWWDALESDEDKCVLLNHPVGRGSSRGIFGPTERANGSNLGVYLMEENHVGDGLEN
ncbi:MAG: hypothetical protein CMJ77_08255 [Planctomycetaceae bacterium]|nr:hypothetical protein [Planctomycetaceae bacterium]